MAFNSNSNNSAARTPRNNDEAWKAEGYLNMYIPRKNGTRMKLVGAPLKMSNPGQKALYDFIQENPEAALQTILSKMVIEFVPVQAEGAGDLDL